jgi:hypothetical protein
VVVCVQEKYGPMGFSKRELKLAEVMHDFNMHVRSDAHVEKAFLDTRDGLLFVRWKGFERRMPSDA